MIVKINTMIDNIVFKHDWRYKGELKQMWHNISHERHNCSK